MKVDRQVGPRALRLRERKNRKRCRIAIIGHRGDRRAVLILKASLIEQLGQPQRAVGLSLNHQASLERLCRADRIAGGSF